MHMKTCKHVSESDNGFDTMCIQTMAQLLQLTQTVKKIDTQEVHSTRHGKKVQTIQ